MTSFNFASIRTQRGSTLIVAIVLLLLLTLVGLFAVRVGMSEQRASGAEFRNRIVRQVAESALSQSFEYLRLSRHVPTEPQGEVDLTKWQPCAAGDTTFPCGVVPQTVLRDTDDDGAADDSTPYRAAAYRYIAGDGYDLDGDGNIETGIEDRLMPMPNIAGTTSSQGVTDVGNFPVRYGVAAVLCSLDANGACVGGSGDDEDRTGLATVTLVSIAEIPGENARATIAQTYGTFNIISVPPSAPPLVSGAILQGLGNATLVGNPDSGGVGVNVSLWSRGPADFNGGFGSWQTCQLDEYIRSSDTPGASDSGVLVCDDCNCLDGETLSGKDAVCDASGSCENGFGPDIQIPDGGASDDALYLGPDQLPNTADDTIPSQFFPCDLFGHIFGTNARHNTNGVDSDGDGVDDGEAGLPYAICEDGVDGDADGRLDSMVQYLQLAGAKRFGVGRTDPDNLNADGTEKSLADCRSLDAGSNGLYWMDAAQCDLNADQVGSPEHPVIIVGERGFQLIGTRIFGVLVGVDSRLIDLNEGDLGTYTPGIASGGGKSSVYGSIILEGGGTFNANVDLVASPKVLENINADENSRRFGTVPGSWTDRFSF